MNFITKNVTWNISILKLIHKVENLYLSKFDEKIKHEYWDKIKKLNVKKWKK